MFRITSCSLLVCFLGQITNVVREASCYFVVGF